MTIPIRPETEEERRRRFAALAAASAGIPLRSTDPLPPTVITAEAPHPWVASMTRAQNPELVAGQAPLAPQRTMRDLAADMAIQPFAASANMVTRFGEGAARLVGADRAADALRDRRQEINEITAPTSSFGTGARVMSDLVASGLPYMAAGGGSLGLLRSAGLTGIESRSDDGSLVKGMADLTGSDALKRLADSPFRGAADVGVDVAFNLLPGARQTARSLMQGVDEAAQGATGVRRVARSLQQVAANAGTQARTFGREAVKAVQQNPATATAAAVAALGDVAAPGSGALMAAAIPATRTRIGQQLLEEARALQLPGVVDEVPFGERLYSRLQRAITAAPFERGTAEQWSAALGQGVPKAEREWRGIDQFLADNAGKTLTRDEVQAAFDAGQPVRITESVLRGETARSQEAEAKVYDLLQRFRQNAIKRREAEIGLPEIKREYNALDRKLSQLRVANEGILRKQVEDLHALESEIWRVNDEPELVELFKDVHDVQYRIMPLSRLLRQHGAKDFSQESLAYAMRDPAERARLDRAMQEYLQAPTYTPSPDVLMARVVNLLDQDPRMAAAADAVHRSTRAVEDVYGDLPQRTSAARQNLRNAEEQIYQEFNRPAGEGSGYTPEERAAIAPLRAYLDASVSRTGRPRYPGYIQPGKVDSYREVVIDLNTGEPWNGVDNADRNAGRRHWPDSHNNLLHVRLTDRTLPNGERVLFVEELQSDVNQGGRKYGWDTPEGRQAARDQVKAAKEAALAANAEWERLHTKVEEEYDDELMRLSQKYGGPGITDWRNNPNAQREMSAARQAAVARMGQASAVRREAERQYSIATNRPDRLQPVNLYANTGAWTELGLKRILDEAARGNYDRVAIVTGEQAAATMGLASRISELEWRTYDGGRTFQLRADGGDVNELIPAERLGEYIGDGLADRIFSEVDRSGSAAAWGTMDAREMGQFGGTGMRKFYGDAQGKATGPDGQPYRDAQGREITPVVPKAIRDYAKALGVKIDLETVSREMPIDELPQLDGSHYAFGLFLLEEAGEVPPHLAATAEKINGEMLDLTRRGVAADDERYFMAINRLIKRRRITEANAAELTELVKPKAAAHLAKQVQQERPPSPNNLSFRITPELRERVLQGQRLITPALMAGSAAAAGAAAADQEGDGSGAPLLAMAGLVGVRRPPRSLKALAAEVPRLVSAKKLEAMAKALKTSEAEVVQQIARQAKTMYPALARAKKATEETATKKAVRNAVSRIQYDDIDRPRVTRDYGELEPATFEDSPVDRFTATPAAVRGNAERALQYLLNADREPWRPREFAFPRGPIQDALTGWPGQAQTAFPRWQPTDPELVGRMDEIYSDPANRRLIKMQIERGLPFGGETFYPSLYPLYQVAQEAGIPGERVMHWIEATAPASARNSIMNENAAGNFLVNLHSRGMELDEETVRREMDAFKARYGVGLPLMPVHREGVRNVLEGGSLRDILTRPVRIMSEAPEYKIPTYGVQKTGDFAQSWVGDVHEAAGETIGSRFHPYFADQGGFKPAEYALAEQHMRGIADEMGLPLGTAQAGRWFGGGELTGLVSPRGDALDILEKQVAYTLHSLGQEVTPRSVRNYTLQLIREGGTLLPWFDKARPMPDMRFNVR